MVSEETLTRGQQFEKRCLGVCSKHQKLIFMNFRDAIGLAKSLDPTWIPTSPPTLFGRSLLSQVGDVLGRMLKVSKSKKRFDLSLYPTVGTPLDFFHGVDAFLALRDLEFNHDFIITLDFSLNVGKIVGKADFVISEDDVDKIENGILIEKVEMIAKQLWVYWHAFVTTLKQCRCK